MYSIAFDVCEDQVLVVVKEFLAACQQRQQVQSTTASGRIWLCMELQAGAVDSPSATSKNY